MLADKGLEKVITPVSEGKRQIISGICKTLENRILTDRLAQPFFKIYGTGMNDIGEKALELLVKSEAIQKAGFEMLPRHILGISFLDGFLERCGAKEAYLAGSDLPIIQQMIQAGEFSAEEKRVFAEISNALGFPMLAVRSSAKGDSRGTGIYDSFYCKNTPDEIEAHTKMVLASYFTQDAVLFRKDAGLPEGMAIMVEPLVCEAVRSGNKTYYAPVISGFGNTSSPKEGAWFVAVGGLAADVVNDPRSGLPIRKSHYQYYLIDEGYGGQADDIDTYFPFDHRHLTGRSLSPDNDLLILSESGASTNIEKSYIHFKSPEPKVGRVFERLEKLEQLCGGTRQYFEFASTGGKEYITQISSVPVQKVDFDTNAESVMASHNVFTSNSLPEIKKFLSKYHYDKGELSVLEKLENQTNVEIQGGYGACLGVRKENDRFNVYSRYNLVLSSGQRICKNIIRIRTSDDWDKIGKLNQKYKDYLLLFSLNSISKINVLYRVAYSSINNASAFATVSEYDGAMDTFTAHFGGRLAITGKLLVSFGSMDKTKLGEPRLENGLSVYDRKIRLTASEDEQKSVLELI